MKHHFYILLLAFALFACEKYPESGTEIIENINFTIRGSDQFTEAGHYLSDSVGLQIDMQSIIFNGNNNFVVTIDEINGGGSVDQSVFEVNADGKVMTNWKLGSESNTQSLNLVLSDANGNYLTSAQINATSYLFGEWNRIESGFLTGISDMVSDTIDHRSLMISGGKIFRSGENFYSWEASVNSSNPGILALELNSNHVLFGITGNDKLFKSNDWGQSWEYVNDLMNNIYEFTITSDNYLWISSWQHGVLCSKDNGLNWQQSESGLPNEERLGRIYRLNNSSHIALAVNNLKILQTFDDGITWTPLNTPQYSLACFVTNKNEIIALNQDNGYSVYKSQNYGQTYELVQAIPTEYGSWPITHTFANFGNTYYVLPPGGGLWKTSNFESSDFHKIGDFTEQRFIFIDHRGTLYANGHSSVATYILPE
ncbi:MAG: WD40/YVTN/BNR-like repeat-containing protein [Prolixibacteraceae bacterium]